VEHVQGVMKNKGTCTRDRRRDRKRRQWVAGSLEFSRVARGHARRGEDKLDLDAKVVREGHAKVRHALGHDDLGLVCDKLPPDLRVWPTVQHIIEALPEMAPRDSVKRLAG